MSPGATYYSSRIIAVDDEEANLIVLERMLRRAGYTRVTTIQDSREVLSHLRGGDADLILLDLLMPHLDGYQIMEHLAGEQPEGAYLPILVLTADVTPQALQRALTVGARDFLTKPFDQAEMLLRVHNLLETRHLHLTLQRQLERLEQIGDETRMAVSAMTHDMAQPLAALRLLTETLNEDATSGKDTAPETLIEDLNGILTASEQMGDMITEVSDLTRMQIGRPLVLASAPMDLVKLVRDQVTSASRAYKCRISLETGITSLTGNWDRQRLNRVISNLLSNAVKFSPKRPQITVSIGQDGNNASVSIADNGVGVPAADLEHVFDPYFRASNVTGRIGGSGIGLSSARQIVHQHGGSIRVESEEGAGTTVTLTLPLS